MDVKVRFCIHTLTSVVSSGIIDRMDKVNSALIFVIVIIV